MLRHTTNEQRKLIDNFNPGDLVFNTDKNLLEFFDGVGFEEITSTAKNFFTSNCFLEK